MQRLDELPHCFYAGSGGRACGTLGYIAAEASPGIALSYTEAIVSYWESLRTFPYRGHRRDDIRPGLRITNYKKRAVIAVAVEAELVGIIGVEVSFKEFYRTSF
ncbi:type II toxin-antitoxin system RelE/ParE family toxin [Trinickia sp.]|uniref:type II toxin-antitoxin system RelE/ParE family toxin n=1 Tax=Trinickia sp. TaxID=2571163 RepID=UPI003F7FE4D9